MSDERKAVLGPYNPPPDPFPSIRERIEEIDNLLFDAGVAVLHAKTKRDREYVDRLITDARVRLEQLARVNRGLG